MNDQDLQLGVIQFNFIGKTGGKFVEEGESVDSDESEAPEECIPVLPENAVAREFLKKAPSKGLHMPLGREVKVMQCFRCKAYGHRTGELFFVIF